MRKHRAEVAVAALFVALLAVASIVSTGLALWAIRERNEKEIHRQLAEHKAAAESKAKEEANQQRRIAESALTAVKIQKADALFAADDPALAVAQLADVLRQDRSNCIAAERLLSVLTYRNISLPLTDPIPPDGKVASARFSPDGHRVVTASHDRTARIWDANTGHLLAEFKHDDSVNWAQFSPDGQRVVTASSDGTARVWDTPGRVFFT